MLSVIDFKIESGKKHQIRAHCSEVLGCPIMFDYKYGYKADSINSEKLQKRLELLPERFIRYSGLIDRELGKTYPSEIDGLIYKNYFHSMKDNNFFMLHSYSLRFDYERVTFS